MAKKKKKRPKPLVRLGLLLAVVWLISTFTRQFIMRRELRAEIDLKKKEIATIQRDIDSINKEIESKDSLEFVEKVAREDYKMVKPREIIYIDKSKKNK